MATSTFGTYVPVPTSRGDVTFDHSGIRWEPYEYSPVITAVICFMALQLLAVAGRIYVRTVLVKAFGWDDVACLVTLALATAFDVCLVVIWRLTDLRDVALVYPGNWEAMIQVTLATLTLYIVAASALKIALGLLLLRVLVKKWMRWTIYGVMALLTIYGTVFFFIVLFECGPPSTFPRKIIVGQCLPVSTTDGISYTHSVLNALADLTFGVLPVIFLWNAAFSRKAKISVGFILVLGSVGCVCTFIRIGWVHYLSQATETYYITSRGVALMSCIELSIGLVCISLATYRPLVQRYIKRRTPSYYYGDGTRETGGDFASHHGAAEEMGTLGSRAEGGDGPANMQKVYSKPRRSGESSQLSPRDQSPEGKALWLAQSPTTDTAFTADTASVDSDAWRGRRP